MNAKIVISRLKTFFDKDPNTIFAFMFDSYTNLKQKKVSDCDIAIYFVNPPEGIDLLHLMNNLSEIVGMEIDVVVLNNASAFFTDYDEYKFISNMNEYD